MHNGFSGYNQILIVVEDIPKTAFRCPGSKRTFEWLVMPFGLKNASATYQRVMNVIFQDMLGQHMEVYVTSRFPVRPDWRIRIEFGVRDHILGLFT